MKKKRIIKNSICLYRKCNGSKLEIRFIKKGFPDNSRRGLRAFITDY